MEFDRRFFPNLPKFSPLKQVHADANRDTADATTLDKWRHRNNALLKSGNLQRNRSDRLIDDGFRVFKERTEANELAERGVRQNLEHRIDEIGYWEDELEGSLHDIKVEDEKVCLLLDRMRDCVKNNLKPIWQMAKKCLDLRAQRPAEECTEDDISYYLREEMKFNERTTRIFDDIIAKLEEQHRRNNTITYRFKHLKTLAWEMKEATKVCQELAKRDGDHLKKDLLVQMKPVLMNFAQWSAFTQDAVRTGLKEISDSHALRREGVDAIAASDEAIQRLYKDTYEALQRRVTCVKNAKEKLVDEDNKIHERLQRLNEVKDQLTNLYNSLIMPERESQHEQARNMLKTHLHKMNDPVHHALHHDIHEFRDSNSQAARELDKVEKQIVTLRSVSNQLLDDIHRKEEALHVDEVLVGELRNLVKLRKV